MLSADRQVRHEVRDEVAGRARFLLILSRCAPGREASFLHVLGVRRGAQVKRTLEVIVLKLDNPLNNLVNILPPFPETNPPAINTGAKLV